MKLTKKYLRKLIKEAIVEAEDSNDLLELDLILTLGQANMLLIALESRISELHEEGADPEDERITKAGDLHAILFNAGVDAKMRAVPDDAPEWPTDLETRAAEHGADSDDVARAEEEGY